MRKKIRKIATKFLPKGNFKEKIKLFCYNLNNPKDTSFDIIKDEKGNLSYKTTFSGITTITNEALYFVVRDFAFYQHFYKIKKNDIILDAGANCGHLSVYFSKIVGDKGKIYAFEPDSNNVKSIEENISLNKEILKNIKIEELLLWNNNALVDFNEAGTVGSSAVWIPDVNKSVKKQAIRIDDWIIQNNIQKVDFIKMDIEGAEIEALDGCIETIRNLSPNFAIASYHIVNGEQTFVKVEEFFKNINYPYKTIKFNKNEIITFAGLSVNNK